MKKFDLEEFKSRELTLSCDSIGEKQFKEPSKNSFQELPLPNWEGRLLPVRIESFSEDVNSSVCKKSRSSNKMKVWFGDNTFMLLYSSEIRQFHLKEKVQHNDLLEGEEYTEFMQALCKRARAKAMSLLKDRDRTEYDIRMRLSKNGFPENVLEDTISYLYHYHYLDDTRYVSQYLFQNRERKSTRQIVQDLKQRGMSDEMIEQALERENEVVQVSDNRGENNNKEEKAARILYEKYCRRKPVNDLKSRQKAASYLMNKGFSWETIRLIVFDSFEL